MKKPFFLFLIIITLFSCKQNSTGPTSIDSIVVCNYQYDSIKSVIVFIPDSVFLRAQAFIPKITLSSDANGDMIGYNINDQNGNTIDSVYWYNKYGIEIEGVSIRYYVRGTFSIKAYRKDKTTGVTKQIASNKFRVIDQ